MKLDSKTKKAIKQFVEERNRAVYAVVMGEDVEVFKAFVKKWQDLGFYPPCFALPSDEVLKASIRKMCIATASFSDEIKNEAKYWLLAHGYTTDI